MKCLHNCQTERLQFGKSVNRKEFTVSEKNVMVFGEKFKIGELVRITLFSGEKISGLIGYIIGKEVHLIPDFRPPRIIETSNIVEIKRI